MSNVKMDGGLVILILALSGVAIAGALWWVLVRSTQQVSAQEIVRSACDDMEQVTSYDATAKMTGTQDGVAWGDTLTVSVSVSGDDYHLTITAVSDRATSEYIRVGGVSYTRQSVYGPEWQVSDVPFGDIDTVSLGLGDNPICPEVRGFRDVGEEEVNGKDVIHYTDKAEGSAVGQPDSGPFDDVDESFRGILETKTNNFWIDGDGQIVQHEQNANYLYHLEGQGRQESTTRSVTVFSGIGEANTITVPTVP